VLDELVVRDLGVIEHATVVLGSGMTALTGETGAGKTVLVGAIELLLGGRADPSLVRPGAADARVDGRFSTPDGAEHVLTRVVPVTGRSRAYLDGAPATVAALSALGLELVDLHGQHAHQSLLTPRAQRDALDAFGGIDRAPVREARQALRRIDDELAGLGGDSRARMREIDLLRFQLAEIERAGIDDLDEERHLATEEDLLADALHHRDAGAAADEVLSGDGGSLDLLGRAIGLLGTRGPFTSTGERLRALADELADAARELRGTAERIEPDPERLAEVRDRRSTLRDLRRKYGEDLGAVVAFGEACRLRLVELERHDELVARLERNRGAAEALVAEAASALKAARIAAARPFAAAVEERLRSLAMPRARLEVRVGDADGDVDDGGHVELMLAANPGAPPAPLARAASGGELARTMLALRLALLQTGRSRSGRGPWTLVFDEVDAGIGGATATAVGRALSALSVDRQVLVVTHLPQVAAAADHHLLVTKHDGPTSTTTTVAGLGHGERRRELSRMLAGRPDSEAAQLHADELLAAASAERRDRVETTPSAPSARRRRGSV
jgi:DNA repair protein RecN (Recombination protein N)